MKREDWTILSAEEGGNGPRPAGPPDECFYCHNKVGEQHKEECVLRKRTVVVRLSIDLVVDVPESWDEESITFYYNESSSCSDNRLNEISKLLQRIDEKGLPCSCNYVSAKYLHEASEDEEKMQGTFVKEYKS